MGLLQPPAGHVIYVDLGFVYGLLGVLILLVDLLFWILTRGVEVGFFVLSVAILKVQLRGRLAGPLSVTVPVLLVPVVRLNCDLPPLHQPLESIILTTLLDLTGEGPRTMQLLLGEVHVLQTTFVALVVDVLLGHVLFLVEVNG